MSEKQGHPIVARPLAPPPIARPAETLLPGGRCPDFPRLSLPRLTALADLATIAVLFFVWQLCAAVFSEGLEDAYPDFGVFSVNILLGVLTLASIAALLYVRRQSPTTVGLGRPAWPRAAVASILAVPACYAVVIPAVGIYLVLSGTDMEAMVQERAEFFEIVPDLSIGTLLSFAFFVGLHEEILFRGFVLTRLSTLMRSTPAGVILSAVIFGALHGYQGPIGVIQTTAVGLVFGVVVAVTRSVWPAVISHGIFDTIGLAVIPLLRGEMQEWASELSPAVT